MSTKGGYVVPVVVVYVGHRFLYLYGWVVCEYVFIGVMFLCGYLEIGDFKGGGCMNLLSLDWE